jgi:magnesium-transporting ATPase (P-type)
MTQMVYFFIYKNLVLTLIPVLHSLSSGEVDIYSPLNNLMYNAFFTFFFSLSIGCFYTGYNRLEISENPYLYQERRNRIDTSVPQLSLWCASALIHAFIIYGFGFLAFGEGVVANGRVAGSLDFGSYLFLVVVVTVCMKLVSSSLIEKLFIFLPFKMFIETIILPNRRTNLEPRIFLSKIILGIGSISVIFSILFMFFDDWNIHLPQLMFSDDNVDTHVSRYSMKYYLLMLNI